MVPSRQARSRGRERRPGAAAAAQLLARRGGRTGGAWPRSAIGACVRPATAGVAPVARGAVRACARVLVAMSCPQMAQLLRAPPSRRCCHPQLHDLRAYISFSTSRLCDSVAVLRGMRVHCGRRIAVLGASRHVGRTGFLATIRVLGHWKAAFSHQRHGQPRMSAPDRPRLPRVADRACPHRSCHTWEAALDGRGGQSATGPFEFDAGRSGTAIYRRSRRSRKAARPARASSVLMALQKFSTA